MKTGSKLLEKGSKLILIENSTILMDKIKINGIPMSNEIFVSKGGNLTRTNFDHMNPFQSYRQHYVNIGHQLNPVQRV